MTQKKIVKETTLEIKDDISTIETYVNNYLKNFKHEWKNDNKGEGNILHIKEKTIDVGKLLLNDKKMVAVGDVVVKHLKNLLKKKEEAEKNKLTPKKVENTLFSKLFENTDKYNGLENNFKIFKLINSELKKIGIENIEMRKNFKMINTLFKKLTLCIETNAEGDQEVHDDGFLNRLKAHIFNNYEKTSNSVDNFYISENVSNPFSKLEGENVKKLKLKDFVVGNYYTERNFIQLFFNPFKVKKIGELDEKLSILFKDLFKEIGKLKPVLNDVSKTEEKIFITAFLSKAKQRVGDIKAQKTSYESNLSNYQREITSIVRLRGELDNELVFIKKNIEMNGKNMFKELKEVKKLPFITKTELKGDKILFYYSPACIIARNFTNFDHGKNFGNRTMYVGNIHFEISSSGFKVFGDAPTKTLNTHPHGGDHNNPCFGSGEASRKIAELLSANKFTEVAKWLWFWIKTYRNDGAYVHFFDYYNDRLSQGYPVWDEKNKRIEINDPKRIKTGEQKKLTKNKNYETNFKKFEHMKKPF